MYKRQVYAYVLRGEGASERIRYSDDGEPQKTAGLPTLQALQHAGIVNVACVVTRYFGGTLLGTGGLVRAYTQATQAALEQADLVAISRCVDLTIRLGYPLYDPFVRIAADANAKIIDTRYADDVTLCVRMLDGEQDALLLKLTELCHGQEDVAVSEPIDALF